MSSEHDSSEDSPLGGEPYYIECALPQDISCDGLRHYWAIFDEETNRWFPQESGCPHHAHNRAVDSYWFHRDRDMSHADALALVRAHGGDI